MSELFLGSVVALATPMHKDGSIDFEAYKVLVSRMIENGVQALLVNGTTAETSTLTVEEEHELLKIAVEINQKRVPIIAGTGSNDTDHALRESKIVKELGADACLIVTPYYNKTSQRGLIQHFTYLADHIGLPIILYNIPGRTGLKINLDTAVELAKHPNIIAMKDATGDMAYTMDLLAATKDMDFDVYSGEDGLILPFIAAGGKGVISVLSNIYPRECQQLCEYVLKGDMVKAQQLAYDLNPVVKGLFADVNPICVKTALKYQGICEEYLRMPLIPTTDEIKEQMINAMKEFESKGY